MKSNKQAECKRQFIVSSQAWYAGSCNLKPGEDEILLGMYHPEGGTTGEFSIKWTMVGNQMTPCLRAYDDSWSALYEFSDMLQELAKLDGTNPSVDVVVTALLNCGVEDATPRTGPRSKNPASLADLESAAQVYLGTLQAYETLRKLVRDQCNASDWAKFAEYGIPPKRSVSADPGLLQQVLALAHAVVTRREEVRRLVESMGDASFKEKYQDILWVPALAE